MNTDTRLVFPYEDVPKNGTMLEIENNVRWIRMPLPMSLNHINLWLIGELNQSTLIDTGMYYEDVKNAWNDILRESDIKLENIIVTHMHPDHIGMAGWLSRHFQIPLSMSRGEYYQCRVLASDTGDRVPEEAINFYKNAGLTDHQIDAYVKRFGFFGSMISTLPDSYKRLKNGDSISFANTDWSIIDGYGHSPEHICLYSNEKKLLIAGDQLLPTITSNVGVFPTEPYANPLEDWLDSCKKLKNIVSQDALVLPSHGRPFLGAHKRLDAIINHHETALTKLHNLLAEPMRSVDTFEVLFKREIDDTNLLMATGESLAHLNCLIERGLAKKYFKKNVAYYEQV